MKFRARLGLGGLKTLSAVANCLDKVSDECAVHLTEDTFELRKKLEAECEVEVFASLVSDSFSEYIIQSKADNTISFIISLKNLLRAFRSAEQGDECVLKLARKEGVPCLSIAADTVSGLNVTQDVPIKTLLTKEGMEAYREPKLPRPCVTASFPDPRHVRAVLERMRMLDKRVTLDFNARKEKLTFTVRSEVVSMRTVYGGLDVQMSADYISRVPSCKVSAMVSIAEFLSVLHFISVNFEKLVVCCIENTAIVLYVGFEDDCGTLTYYCPLIDPEDSQLRPVP